jgi:hypothetical protein
VSTDPTPWTVLNSAIARVPAAKYLLLVAALGATFSIVRLFSGGGVANAVIVVSVMAVAVVGMLAFAKLSSFHQSEFRGPALVLLWSFVLLFVTSAALAVSSVFFGVPIDLRPGAKDGRKELTFRDGATLDEVGGHGGSGFEAGCEDGDVVVGIFGASGNDAIWSFGIDCARLRLVDAQTPSGMAIDLVPTSSTESPIGFLGSGPLAERKCPEGSFVNAIGVETFTPPGWDRLMVRSLRIYCARPVPVSIGDGRWRLDGERVQSLAELTIGRPSRVKPNSCPKGSWVTGFLGRFGEMIDAVGAQCRTVVIAAN